MVVNWKGRSFLENLFDVSISFDNQQEAYALLGGHDEFLHVLMEAFACRFVSRGNELTIRGDESEVRAAALVIGELQQLFRQGTSITMHEVRYSIRLAKEGQGETLRSMMRETVLMTAKGRVVRPKTVGQQQYLEAIRHHAVTFGVGPAGTGKTYLAVVMAVAALRAKQVSRIILTRPAVEAGEMSEDDLNALRDNHREAQFYWDYVFVENGEGFHNQQKQLGYLDHAQKIIDEAMSKLN